MPPGNFDAGAPWTLGPGIAEPALWGLVEEFVGDLWPNGNLGQITLQPDAGAALVQRFKVCSTRFRDPMLLSPNNIFRRAR